MVMSGFCICFTNLLEKNSFNMLLSIHSIKKIFEVYSFYLVRFLTGGTKISKEHIHNA